MYGVADTHYGAGHVECPLKNTYISRDVQLEFSKVLEQRHFSSGGSYTEKCNALLGEMSGAAAALIVQSCSCGLEVAMTIANVGPGDEVIMPSFNFASAANAVVQRGGIPVFVDIRPDTQNIDETLVEAAVTPLTRAILCVDYGGVYAEIDKLATIATEHGLLLIDDAAHAFQARYKRRNAGQLADIAVFSFHDTKDVSCGEGGAVLINRRDLIARAKIITEKGTNRDAFNDGFVDFYSWLDVGQSAKPSEFTACILWAQLGSAAYIKSARLEGWNTYDAALAPLEAQGLLRRPVVPSHCDINGHNYYVILADDIDRAAVIAKMRQCGFETAFHFVPLHLAPAGKKYARVVGAMPHTVATASRILRLPLWPGVTPFCIPIVDCLDKVLRACLSRDAVMLG